MDSRRSGSLPNETDLLKVETDDFHLVLRGKPFHERFLGLQQYRGMDFNEHMELTVKGNNIVEAKVYDLDSGELQQITSHRPIFFENGIYTLFITPKQKKELQFYHEHPGLQKAVAPFTAGDVVGLMGNLQFTNEVGYTTFAIKDEAKTLLDVTLEIFPTKLDFKKDYVNLLEEVNEEIYNLAYHILKKTYLKTSSGFVEKPSLAEFYRLITFYFEAFMRAVQHIERQPHHQLVTTYRKVRGDQLRKVDTVGRKYLRQRPHLFQKVDNGIPIHNESLMPTEGLLGKKDLSFNTLENQFVKWMMLRLNNKLEDFHKHLYRNRSSQNDNDDIQYEDISNKVQDMIDQIKSQLKKPFWKDISHLNRSVMSLVLQMAPGYREAYEIYLKVSRGLVLQGQLYDMSVKDVATLYEYWTFLKIGQILNKKCKLVSQDVVEVRRDGLFVNLSANKSAQRTYEHPITNERITLTYQYKSKQKLPTIGQAPDIMLSIEKKGKNDPYKYVFDAKYRIDFGVEGTDYGRKYNNIPGPLEDDINTMHRYRDSLVVQHNGPYEREAFGAYVLFPFTDESTYRDHKLYNSIQEVNIGGIPFLPNATDTLEQFIDRLIEKSPEEIHQEGILPIGTTDEWKSSIDESVLVGMVRSSKHYEAHLKHGFYHIPVRELKNNGWQEAKYVALYLKKDVSQHNGIAYLAKVTDMKIVRRKQITEIPANPNRLNETYVYFKVEPWRRLDEVIRPVKYGISVYTMTTLNTIKQSKELPEIFMKSKEEVTLWRMLRRISDQVRIDLDHHYLDRATGIQSYKVKDISISFDYEVGKLKLSKNEILQEYDIKLLEKTPSTIFKEMLMLL